MKCLGAMFPLYASWHAILWMSEESVQMIRKSMTVVPRIPFSEILQHPLRAEIDQKLFVEHEPVRLVHRWVEEDAARSGHGVDFSYWTLWRYAKTRADQPVGKFVAEDVHA